MSCGWKLASCYNVAVVVSLANVESGSANVMQELVFNTRLSQSA